MKTVLCLALLAALAAAPRALAQDPDSFHPPPPGPGPGPGIGPGAPFGQPHHPPQEMVQKWLEQLKSRNPQEYERLAKLREEDPEAFRQELEKRLDRERGRRFVEKYPQLKEALEAMPEQDRNAVLRRLAGGGPGPGPGAGPHGPGGLMPPGAESNPRSPEIDRLQDEVKDLALQFKAAATEAERQKAREEIRGKLSKLFDLREDQRRQDLQRMEKHVAELKQKLESRQSRKDQIIDRRLQQLTGAEDLAW